MCIEYPKLSRFDKYSAYKVMFYHPAFDCYTSILYHLQFRFERGVIYKASRMMPINYDDSPWPSDKYEPSFHAYVSYPAAKSLAIRVRSCQCGQVVIVRVMLSGKIYFEHNGEHIAGTHMRILMEV